MPYLLEPQTPKERFWNHRVNATGAADPCGETTKDLRMNQMKQHQTSKANEKSQTLPIEEINETLKQIGKSHNDKFDSI